jgi:hypothetical protein
LRSACCEFSEALCSHPQFDTNPITLILGTRISLLSVFIRVITEN